MSHNAQPPSPLRVFLSSTFRDLKQERMLVERAIHRLGANFVGMEHFGSFAEEPLRHCLRKVESADIVVLVLGNEYGSIPPGRVISFTDAEYRHALRRRLPVLAYTFGDPADLQSLYLKQHQKALQAIITEQPSPEPSESERRLSALRSRLYEKGGVSYFISPEDLAWKLACDLGREAAAIRAGSFASELFLHQVGHNIDDLISLLDVRADIVRKDLAKHVKYSEVRSVLRSFNRLHRQHVTFLRSGKILQAYEVLKEIHKLSDYLEQVEGARERAEHPPRLNLFRYARLVDHRWRPGRLIRGYVTGFLQTDAHEYSKNIGYTRNGELSLDACAKLYRYLVKA